MENNDDNDKNEDRQLRIEENELTEIKGKRIEDAFNSLVNDPAKMKAIRTAANQACGQYRTDRYGLESSDLADIMMMKICEKNLSPDNPNSFDRWCRVMANRLCLDVIRHRSYEIKYIEGEKKAPDLYKRNGNWEAPSIEVTLEEDYSVKEQLESIDKKTMGEIVRLWAEGKSPREIADAVGKSLQTVYRLASQFQQGLKKGTVVVSITKPGNNV